LICLIIIFGDLIIFGNRLPDWWIVISMHPKGASTG
jgi:hypothetical protein